MTEEGRKIFNEYYNNFVKEHDRSPNIEEAFFDGNKILVEQAKEIITNCLRNMQDDTGDMKPVIEQAEQFLKEVENGK